MSQSLQLIGVTGATGWIAYLVANIAILLSRLAGSPVPDLVRLIRMELRPFALGLVLAAYLPLFADGASPFDVLNLSLGLYGWYSWRHDKDDDDRWKRRKQKLADKVAEVGGRLVLVPATSPP